MANTEKRTQKDIYTEMVAIFTSMDRADLVDFCEKKIEQVAKRNSTTKPTEKQVENEMIKAEILGYLASAEKPMTIAEIMDNALTGYVLTNQRVSALLTQLGEKGTKEIVKTYDKKKAYFSIAE